MDWGGGRKWESNEQYLEYLSGLVLKYKASQGALPKNIDDAINKLDVRLPNRGDLNGNPLFYATVDNEAFMMRSYGANRQNDFGNSDDRDICYIGSKSVSRMEFINFIKKYKNGFYWDVYGDQFRE